MKTPTSLIELLLLAPFVAVVSAHGGLRMTHQLAAPSLAKNANPESSPLELLPALKTVAGIDHRSLQEECPSIGDLQCSPNPDCTCSDPDAPQSSGTGTDGATCYFCLVADGSPCSAGDFQCKPDVSRCVDGTCFSREDRPLICPNFVIGTFPCQKDASCVCQDPTPFLATNSNGCRVCHAKADNEACSGSGDCSPNSYCDVATKTCLPDSVCPTQSDTDGFSCITDSSCECASAATTKTQVDHTTLPNTICNVCFTDEQLSGPPPGACPVNTGDSCDSDEGCTCGGATPNKAESSGANGEKCFVCHASSNGESCSAQGDCSPASYCDEATGVCLDDSVCPTISSDGQFSCNTDASCACAGAAAMKSSLPGSDGATCYVCAAADGQPCTDGSQCSPSSYCDLATSTCLANSVCPSPTSEGTFSCNTDATCSCTSGTKSSIESTSQPGVICNVCTPPEGTPCTDQTDCSPTSFCDAATGTCLDRDVCPTISSTGEYTCITDSCECAPGTGTKTVLELDAEPGTFCNVCTPMDGVACSTESDCGPSSYCDRATGTCLSESVCPTIPSEGPYTCNTDSACECAAGTGTKSAVPLATSPGSFCHVCAAPDGATCSVTTDCSPNSYCDTATKTCLADDVCPTISSTGDYSCIKESCECAPGTGTKSTVESSSAPGTFCQVCATADGGACTSGADCAPNAYCDLGNTNKCIPDSVCPEMASNGGHTCNTDPSCSCAGAKSNKVALESTSNPGTMCHVCFFDDNSEECSGFNDCAPSSRCELTTGTCVSDSVCLFTENRRCTIDAACSCPVGRTQKRHTLSAGSGSCYTCELNA